MIRYTEEEIKFISDNYYNMSKEELTKSFNTIFKKNVTLSSIYQLAQKKRITKRKCHRYTEEQLNWLRDHKDLKRKELMVLFNETFKTNVTQYSIDRKLARSNLVNKLGDDHYYTDEMNNFLIEHSDIDRVELTKIFNDHFNDDRSYIALSEHCRKMGLKVSKELFSNTQSKSSYSKKPLFSERIKYRHGKPYILIKIFENKQDCDRNWVYKHIYMYEKYIGPIPKGHVVIFLDGNTLNCDLSNLKCMPKGAYMMAEGEMFPNKTLETRDARLICAETIYNVKKIIGAYDN